MVRIVVICEVEDAGAWEVGFRSHGGLFQQMTQRAAHYCITSKNEVILCLEVEDPEQFRAVLFSPAVADAMAADGVRLSTIRFHVLNRTLES